MPPGVTVQCTNPRLISEEEEQGDARCDEEAQGGARRQGSLYNVHTRG